MRPHPAISAQDDPLAVGSGVVIAEPHQQLLITIHQPAFPSWLGWRFMSGAITIRHGWSLALIWFDPRQRTAFWELILAVHHQAVSEIELAHFFEKLCVVNLWFWSKLGCCHGCLPEWDLIGLSPFRSRLEVDQPFFDVRLKALCSRGLREQIHRVIPRPWRRDGLVSRSAQKNVHDWDQLELPSFIDLFTL